MNEFLVILINNSVRKPNIRLSSFLTYQRTIFRQTVFERRCWSCLPSSLPTIFLPDTRIGRCLSKAMVNDANISLGFSDSINSCMTSSKASILSFSSRQPTVSAGCLRSRRADCSGCRKQQLVTQQAQDHTMLRSVIALLQDSVVPAFAKFPVLKEHLDQPSRGFEIGRYHHNAKRVMLRQDSGTRRLPRISEQR